MCGISGVYNFARAGSDDDRRIAIRMRDAMIHRGPDGAGLYQDRQKRVVLAHRRLSIIDLSPAGHQPMSNEDESVWITFNGEIYNHEALRKILQEKGHQFKSRCDTEAIVHLYEEVGADCVEHLDGMFAFALWDERRQTLLLARDRLGKKPLYYTSVGGQLLFASEIKALVQHPAVTRDLDLVALNQYLSFSNVPAPLTLFKNVFKLPAAHTIVCSAAGRLKKRRYWSPLDGAAWPRSEPADSADRLADLLRRAVRKRLMSDVPIGAFLSGGVDSSTNVALMSELSSQPLRTFSVGFEGFGAAENFHDLPYARQVARRFGCRHDEVTVTARECQDLVPQLVFQQDEPLGDPACLPMHFVAKAAKSSGVTVVLVGEGSDEVFGGYADMARLARSFASRWQPLTRLPFSVRSFVHRTAKAIGVDDNRLDVLRRAAAGEPFYWGLDIVFSETEKRRLFRPGALDSAGSDGSSAAVVAGYYDEVMSARPDADFLQQIGHVELSNRLPDLLLMRVDKFSMAHSLEARAPFLDHELVSYGLGLPQDAKVGGGQTKRALKAAVRGILPNEIVMRQKQGFRVPLPEWLRGPLSRWAEGVLFSKSATRLDVLDSNYIRTLWRRHQSGQFDHSFDLWCLIGVFSWQECWLD